MRLIINEMKKQDEQLKLIEDYIKKRYKELGLKPIKHIDSVFTHVPILTSHSISYNQVPQVIGRVNRLNTDNLSNEPLRITRRERRNIKKATKSNISRPLNKLPQITRRGHKNIRRVHRNVSSRIFK